MLTRREFTTLLAAGMTRMVSPASAHLSGVSDFDLIRYRTVRDYSLAYRETGVGDAFLFLHGNPTSSYLWRRVAPALADLGRCVAPDLLGMGHSAKARPGDEVLYTVAGQRELLADFIDTLELGDRIVLVVHDWGSVFGFDWARRHPGRVRGIVHMEAFVEPVTTSTTPEAVVRWFRNYRTPEGERAVLEDNQFVEQVLFRSARTLGPRDSAAYREPFQVAGASRLPTLVFPQQVPIDGEPADVHAMMMAAWQWMATSDTPKLFINAEPGAMVVARRKVIARSWRNTTERQVQAMHFVPEDAPDGVVAAIREWLPKLTGT